MHVQIVTTSAIIIRILKEAQQMSSWLTNVLVQPDSSSILLSISAIGAAAQLLELLLLSHTTHSTIDAIAQTHH